MSGDSGGESGVVVVVRERVVVMVIVRCRAIPALKYRRYVRHLVGTSLLE